MNPILRLEGVSISFGGIIAADNVAFSVMPGEAHGLIGPNGAGKSTLMNIISGILTADSGKVYFAEKDLSNVPAYDRARMGIGRTFQTPRFLQRSNILDNMLVGTDLADQSGYLKSFFIRRNRNFEHELHKYLDILGFKVDLESDISVLSYGQLKSLEIVRALLSHPKVMLVDEPAAGLNNVEIEKAMALLNIATKEYGIGVLLIEHTMDMVMNFCEQIVVIHFGKVIAQGTPNEISINPDVIEAYLGSED